MSIVVIGVSHHTAALDVLGALAIPGDATPKALANLVERAHISEVVVLSTCTRTEIYALAEKFHGAYDDVREFLSAHSNLPPAAFADSLIVEHDEAAVAHLFRVAAGLESVVPGEHEILGQLRAAADAAREAGTCGATLDHLFRRAVEVGRRARSETGIGRSVASVSQAAVIMADARIGGLADRRVAVVGAGEMGRGMASLLAGYAVADLVVLNRDRARADALAAEAGGRAVPLGSLAEVISGVDVVVTSTGSPLPLIDTEALDGRGGTPLLLVDIAVPRDVDPSVRQIDGVDLLDMDDLDEFVQHGRDRRSREIPDVERIVAEELDRYGIDRRSRAVAPLVTALRRQAEEFRIGELERFASALESMDDDQREIVEAVTKGLVGKLLHEPTVRLKSTAGSAAGERLARSLTELFDL